MRRDVRFLSPLRRLGLSAAALWLGSLVAAAPAVMAADIVPEAVFFYKLGAGTSDGPLVVTLNDQGVWTDSQETERTWSLAFRVEWATAIGMVKDFKVYAKPGSGLGSAPDVIGTLAEIVHPNQKNVTWALIEQGKIAQFEVVAAVDSVFPHSGTASTPAGVCQLKRNQLLVDGTPPYDIIANDWIVEKEAKIRAVLEYYKDFEPSSTSGGFGAVEGTDPAHTSAVVTVPLLILCKGDKAIADALKTDYQGSYAGNFQVTDAKLAISPAYQNLTADCPVTVPLVAEFAATNAGSLKFRFVSAGGKVSPLRTVNIIGKTGGVYKALYEEQIQVPLVPASGAAGGQGGGGIVNQQGGGGFAVQTQPEEPMFPTAPSSGGMGQVQVNPTPGNIHSESFRVEVVEPAPGIVSAYAGYHITCKPKGPGIATVGSVQMQPQTPPPDGATTVIGGIQTPPAAPAPRQAQVQLPQMGALTSGAKPDVMGTTLGFLLGGHHPWGSTIVIDKPQLATATGVGPNKNFCRFAQAGYRPFNKGDAATGPFKNRVYRGSQTVDQSIHNLGPKQTDGWHVFALELPSGLSTIRVVMDADKQVAESDEDNTFAVRVNVLLDCGGQPPRRAAPGVRQPAPLQRAPTLQPRLPQRQ